MNYVGRLLSNVRDFYMEINSATLTGAIDVVAIERENGDILASPFHVRFGKASVLHSREKVVDICVNDEQKELQMKLGEGGEAFFVVETEELDEDIPPNLATSPIPSTSKLMQQGVRQLRQSAAADVAKKLDLGGRSQPGGSQSSQEDEEKDNLSANIRRCYSDHAFDYDTEVVESVKRSDAENEQRLNSTESSTTTSEIIVTEYTQTSAENVPGQETNKLSQSTRTFIAKHEKASLVKKLRSRKQRDKDLVDSRRRKLQLRRVKSWSGILSYTETDETNTRQSEDRSNHTFSTQSSLITERGGSTARDDTVRWSITGVRREKYSAADVRKASCFSKQESFVTAYDDSRKGSVYETEEMFQMEDVEDSLEDSLTNNDHDSPSTTYHQDKQGIYGPKVPVVSLPMDISATASHSYSHSEDTEEEDQTPSAQSRGFSRSLPQTLADMHLDGGANKTPAYVHFHPFSDTDATPGESRDQSRSASPAKSDSELERRGKDLELGLHDDDAEWKWGQLPDKTPTQEQPPLLPSVNPTGDKASGWNLSSMWYLGNYLRKTKKERHEAQTEGIYLQDLIQNKSEEGKVDPELAALYFPKSRMRSGDVERGTRDSVVESPRLQSAPDDMGYGSNTSSVAGDPTFNSPFEEHRLSDTLGDLALSHYGILEEGKEVDEDVFERNIISYDTFSNNPNIIFDPDLVVKLHGKYLTGKEALPSLVSLLVFQRPLNATQDNQASKSDESPGEQQSESEAAARAKSTERPSSGMSSWFYWGSRRAASVDPGPSDAGPLSPQPNLDPLSPSFTSAEATTGLNLDNSSPFITDNLATNTPEKLVIQIGNKRYKKTLRLTPDQLRSLNLRRGSNEVRFSVTTKMQGTAFCTCNIYLWRYDDKIVISDIDGTITKSDVLGQILPAMGNQWAQAGVAQLYNRIVSNGYKLVYLSARAIGQSSLTKSYLRSIRQDELSLPHGPLFLSPTSLISALHREVIEKNPEEFKKSCLKDILALFDNHNPFYAGFGNKINDVWAYEATGVPHGKIFTINHKGEVRHELTKGFSSTYVNMSLDFVDHIFPPLTRHGSVVLPNSTSGHELRTYFTAPETYSNFTYWKNEGEVKIDLAKFPPPQNTKPKTAVATTTTTTPPPNDSNNDNKATKSTTEPTASTTSVASNSAASV